MTHGKTYPASSDVDAGNPAQESEYDLLRQDALYLGSEDDPGDTPANNVDLHTWFDRHSNFVILEILGTDKVRVVGSTLQPPTIIIETRLIQNTANADLPDAITGGSGTRYIFANRVQGSTEFTLTESDSPTEGINQKLIGNLEWTGSAITETSIESVEEKDAGVKNGDRRLAQVWANISTGASIIAHEGLASVANISTGIYRLTFEVPFSTTNYVVVATMEDSGPVVGVGNLQTGTVDIEPKTSSGAPVDGSFHAVIYGDQ